MAQLPKHTNLILPSVIVLCLAYYNYASAYVVGFKEIYKHHSRAGAIVVWVLEGILQLALLASWSLILLKGPGKTPRIPLFDIYDTKDPDLLPVPDIFLCDKHGYPYWCSACDSIKPKRSFHIRSLNRCVPRFDHKCVWVGTSVGRDNLLFFIHFLIQFGLLFVIALVPAAVTVKLAFNRDTRNLPHYIVIFVCSVLWLPMIFGLLLQQIAFAATNRTTIDDISMKQARKYSEWKKGDESKLPKCLRNNIQRKETGERYVNLRIKDTRWVVPFSVRDHPYSDGFKRNLSRIVFDTDDDFRFGLSLFYIVIPFASVFIKRQGEDIKTYDNASEPFSERFLGLIDEKISRGECSIPLYLQGKKSSAQA